MLCDKCGKNMATTFYKQIINGEVSQIKLCPECAGELGNSSLYMGMPLGGFLSGVLGEGAAAAHREPVRCAGCGMSYREIAGAGRVGCHMCYDTFYDNLMPSLTKIHGRITHVGKIPSSASEELKARSHLTQLKKELSEAIASEEYEKAAALRDEIKTLERGEGHE